MKEIEVLVEVYSPIELVLNKLEQFEFFGVHEVVDTYFYDSLRENLKPNENMQIDECLRLRKKNDINTITYKKDKFEENGKWLYSDEYETKVENLEILTQILEELGFKQLLIIDNTKRVYKYNNYEIVFENVKNLGYFIEVEFCTDEDVDVKQRKKEIQSFINSLNLDTSEELNMGKPEMLIRKFDIKV